MSSIGIVLGLRNLYNKILESPSSFISKEEFNILLKASDIIDNYEKEIERLNSCVKSEDEVREIMKSCMSDMVKETVNEQINLTRKLSISELENNIVNHFKGTESVSGYYVIGLVKSIVKQMLEKEM